MTVMHYTDTKKAASPLKKKYIAVLTKYAVTDKFISSAVRRGGPGHDSSPFSDAPWKTVRVAATLDIAQCIIAVPS